MLRIRTMCMQSNQYRTEPPLCAALFLALSMVSFGSAEGMLWLEPLPWLLLATAGGLWRGHGWARRLAMLLLAGLLVLMALPGGTEFPPVRMLLIDPWTSAGLEHHTGLHPASGGALVASAMLLWLMSPRVRRAFALADLDAVRAGLPVLSDSGFKDDH